MTVIRWLFTAAGLLAILVAVITVVPPRFTAGHHFDTAADELKAQNDVRTTLLQGLAGGVLLLGAYFTYRQLQVTREGQITDRYTKAVDQLGSEHLDVRVGGIYALERIARDSPPDRATIEEVLTAYVRDHAPWPLPPSSLSLRRLSNGWSPSRSGNIRHHNDGGLATRLSKANRADRTRRWWSRRVPRPTCRQR